MGSNPINGARRRSRPLGDIIPSVRYVKAMKLYSWNVNGLRAVWKKDFLAWFDGVTPDVLCLQETKSQVDQLTEEQIHPLGYHSVFASAEKKGYSGVSIYSKTEPVDFSNKMGVEEIDSEGRFTRADFKDFVLLNCYFPNSQREHARLDYKLAFNAEIHQYMNDLVESGKNVILCGDFNVAHKEIDLKNPKTNHDNPGFLPQEREWMTEFLDSGYVDAFRAFNSEGDNYTWWSYRPGVRERNIGWRIDYHAYNADFSDRVKSASIHPEVMGSDHCPISVELKA